MCIAIYSLQGNDVPSEKYLKNSFKNNPDGAGFAFNTDNHMVKIVKGLMTWDSFIETFNKYNKKYNFKDRGLLIHFRITTHGGTCPECCHPFPISEDKGALHKREMISPYGVIHNGIISLTSTEAKTKDKMSDTMIFISKYLTKIASNKRWFSNEKNFEMIYDLIDSKMAILNGYGDIKSTYGFTKAEDGNYYSNSTYSTYNSFNYYNWDWYDDYSEYGYKPYNYDDYGYEKFPASSKRNNEQTELMMVKDDQIVAMDDGSEDWNSDDEVYYITSDGDLYLVPRRKKDNFTVVDMVYIGHGIIFNHMYTDIVKFKATHLLDSNKIKQASLIVD